MVAHRVCIGLGAGLVMPPAKPDASAAPDRPGLLAPSWLLVAERDGDGVPSRLVSTTPGK